MRWPFVARSTYDRHTQVLIDAQASLVRQGERTLDLYEALLDKYHALKVMGASLPEPTPTLPPRTVDPVMQAITDVAGSNRELRSIMSREAMKSRAAGVPDHEIIAQIEAGESAEDGIPA